MVSLDPAVHPPLRQLTHVIKSGLASMVHEIWIFKDKCALILYFVVLIKTGKGLIHTQNNIQTTQTNNYIHIDSMLLS